MQNRERGERREEREREKDYTEIEGGLLEEQKLIREKEDMIKICYMHV
jgi:hypothetical protein